MKRIICILLTLMLLLCAVPAQAEGEFTFILSAAVGEVGDTVTLTGSVANAPICASYRVILTYDPAVLEVVEGSNAGSAGIFIINPKATYKDQPAVNALSADAAKVLEGTQDLFTVTFKIIGENDTENQPIEIAHQEFFAADLSKQVPVIQNGGIRIGKDDPAVETPDAPTEEQPDTDTPTEEQPDTDAPTEEPETEKEEETLPEGNWAIDEKNEEVIFVPENGAPITYVPEFPESIEVGKPTDIILKDENGNDAGSITVEKEEDGTITVIEQNAKLPKGKKTPLFLMILLPLLGVVAAAGITAAILILLKKKKNINKNGENNHE